MVAYTVFNHTVCLTVHASNALYSVSQGAEVLFPTLQQSDLSFLSECCILRTNEVHSHFVASPFQTGFLLFFSESEYKGL